MGPPENELEQDLDGCLTEISERGDENGYHHIPLTSPLCTGGSGHGPPSPITRSTNRLDSDDQYDPHHDRTIDKETVVIRTRGVTDAIKSPGRKMQGYGATDRGNTFRS